MSDANNLLSHLIELRSRILKALLSVLVVFLCLAAFAQDLYQLLAMPLLDAMPENATMIATDVASPFFAPFKLTLVLSFFIAIPYVLYQVWGFVAPGLYRNEKRLVAPLLLSSTLLFYAGMAFALFSSRFPLPAYKPPITTPTSNSSHIGMASKVCEMISGGVSSIPTTKAPTTTKGRFARNDLASVMPVQHIRIMAIGISNDTPNAKNNFNTKFR